MRPSFTLAMFSPYGNATLIRFLRSPSIIDAVTLAKDTKTCFLPLVLIKLINYVLYRGKLVSQLGGEGRDELAGY